MSAVIKLAWKSL
ncbi:hypothetical protein D046_5349A, partial [Vibrio parahaemolyticus V-223/04]